MKISGFDEGSIARSYRVDLPTGSMQDMRRSLSVLSNIDIKGLFPGHGNVMERYDRASFEQVLSLAGV